MSIRVLIADDHAVFRSGLRALIENETDMEVVGEVGDGVETVRAAIDQKLDILLLDISMPGLTGPRVAEAVLKERPRLSIVVLTMHDDEYYLQELFKIGVRAFVLKKSSGRDLLKAIRTAYRGDQYIDPAMAGKVSSPYVESHASGKSDRLGILSRREQEVCRLLAYGHTNSEIAEKLIISERTVETHRAHIMTKLEMRSRVELVRFAIDNGLMETG